MNERSTGFLIAIEGIDGSGKTTLAEILREGLEHKGKNVLALPSGGFNSSEIEAKLRKIVTDENSGITPNTETLIYFASLAQKVEQYIAPALLENKIVIVDRFSLSTLVFSHYMFNQDRQLTKNILQFALKGITPDFTFLCDLDESIAYSRLICQNRELSRREKQGLPLMNVMRKGFLKEIENTSKHFKIVRTDKTPLEQMGACLNELEQYIY